MAYPRRQAASPLEQILVALLLGTGVFVAAVLIFLTGYQLRYAGSIFPGVRVAGVDVGGMTQAEAAAEITLQITYPQNGRILLRGEDQSWLLAPGEIGLFLDPESSAEQAYKIGRSGGFAAGLTEQINAWRYGADIPPALVFDQRMAHQFLSQLSNQFDRPVIEPSLAIEGVEVMVSPGQTGRFIDKDATLALLSQQVQTLQDGAVPLVMREEKPIVEDVSAQAELARTILSQPLTLALPEGQSGDESAWTFEPEELAGMLVFERVQVDGQANYELSVNARSLGEFLYGLSDSLYREPENTRFMFNDDTRVLEVIQPAVIGRELDVEASIGAIKEKLIAGDHNIPLEFNVTEPAVTDDMTGEQLGITELVHAESSYFYGSSSDRIQNIQTAASRFHGLLVAPGETFSMANALGDISLDNGYAEALIIVGDSTVQGVGGGVCQVSTTLFRTAFFAGFPIVERHAHAYRVYYYEQTASGGTDSQLAGLDATVYVPLVDFRFTNDTPHWLLMETYVSTGGSITWKFYSTGDGRSVEWSTTGPENRIDPPEPKYKENPELANGEVKQVDWAAEGADITVRRTVTRDGQVHVQDTFYTQYQPWRDVYEYGPGTEGMPPEDSVGESEGE
jgi:vancomycin resistance protein YoaR